MNIPIFMLAIVWGLAETAYFGWNWAPQSNAELACDALSFLLTALAIAVGPR